VRNRPLDREHHPFKRSRRIGVGPRGRVSVLREDWECDRLAKYKQRCVYVGPITRARGRVKIIKVKPDWKADYNREYWDYLVRESDRTGRTRFANRTRAGYAPRSRNRDRR